MTTRDEYVAKLKKQLDQWNADIATWESKAKVAQVDTKKRYERELEDLRAQREKAMYNLRLIQDASSLAWSDFTHGADEAWGKMREAIAKARKHFEKA
jgi:lipid II:glycine glycyltransferase (peptidoglycan interpeptide bridge formation enzyme)